MEDPLLKLIQMRQETEKHIRNQISSMPNQELLSQNQEIQESQKTISDLKLQLSIKERKYEEQVGNLTQKLREFQEETDSSRTDANALHFSNKKLLEELEHSQRTISDLLYERETMKKAHIQGLSDLRLKHEQELYILKKLKR